MAKNADYVWCEDHGMVGPMPVKSQDPAKCPRRGCANDLLQKLTKQQMAAGDKSKTPRKR